MFDLVEKKDHEALHATFGSREAAECFLREVIPEYVTRNLYCIREGLCANDFEIVENNSAPFACADAWYVWDKSG
jgi:hypothetical protein